MFLHSKFFFLFKKESLFFSLFPFFQEYEVVVEEFFDLFLVLCEPFLVVLELFFGVFVPVVLPVIFIVSSVVSHEFGPVLNVVLVPVHCHLNLFVVIVGIVDVFFDLVSSLLSFLSELLSIFRGIFVGLLLEELPEVLGVQGLGFSEVEVVLSGHLGKLKIRDGFWVSVLSQGSVSKIEFFLHFSEEVLLLIIGFLSFLNFLSLSLTLDPLSLILSPLPVPHGVFSGIDWSKGVIPSWSKSFDFSEELIDTFSEGLTSPFDTLTILILIVVVFFTDSVSVISEHIPLA